MISVVLFIAVLLPVSDAATKHWKWISSWDNPNNWYPPRLPCPNDKIVLKDGVIFMNRNITVQELEIPDSGELVLDDDLELSFEDKHTNGQTPASGRCQGQGTPVEFIGFKARNWLNPLNWEILENGVPSSYTNASLFTDRIPCTTDRVTFPESGAYHIEVSKDISVGFFVMNGKSLGKQQLNEFLSSEIGKKTFTFRNGATISPLQKNCSQTWGCPCGYSKLKASICDSFKCPSSCEWKVKPIGDCCDHCGAVVKLDITPTFNHAKCQKILRDKILYSGHKDVKLVISTMDDSQVQILVTDTTDGTKAVKASRIVAEHLENSKDGICSGNDVKVITATTGSSSSESSSNVAVPTVMTIVIISIVLFVGAFLWRKRQGTTPFKRQEFRNESIRSNMPDVEIVDTAFNSSILSVKGGPYENPLYGQLGPDNLLPDSPKFEIPTSPQNASTQKAEKPMEASFDNPIYSEQDIPGEYDDIMTALSSPEDVGMTNPLYDNPEEYVTTESAEHDTSSTTAIDDSGNSKQEEASGYASIEDLPGVSMEDAATLDLSGFVTIDEVCVDSSFAEITVDDVEEKPVQVVSDDAEPDAAKDKVSMGDPVDAKDDVEQ